MDVSDDDLRALVRDAIRRHGQAPLTAGTVGEPSPAHPHASHGRMTLATGGDPDGRCLIEPAVSCTHCGYCLSLGH